MKHEVNQVGTVTGSIRAAFDSKAAGWGVMEVEIGYEMVWWRVVSWLQLWMRRWERERVGV
ncbi:hypothetical protein NC653_034725 [Populus alba x Populus x berolinensis]|uniref:Uncharacterized protein n=1 Tax=Populus alba x Populus x berolinensis TaxID=444605 RepID=A0AAD6LN72_9ROSI|nr:hypothetical protein NC653_034725 [Populus alba x Populus x berolinensis]